MVVVIVVLPMVVVVVVRAGGVVMVVVVVVGGRGVENYPCTANAASHLKARMIPLCTRSLKAHVLEDMAAKGRIKHEGFNINDLPEVIQRFG